MSTINITIPFDEEKLRALDFSLAKENSSAQKRMEEMLDELYTKSVPEALREYVDSKSAPPAPKQKRQTRQPSKTVAPKLTQPPTNTAITDESESEV